jgi:hypothetical protein
MYELSRAISALDADGPPGLVEEAKMYQVWRHESEAGWVDISHRAFLSELCAEGCADPYVVANRLRTGPMLVTQLARYRSAGARSALTG